MTKRVFLQDISRNPIRSDGFEILSSLFVNDEMPMIKKFNVSREKNFDLNERKKTIFFQRDFSVCQLTDADGIFLKKIVKGGEMLEELDLSRNQFGPSTCKNLGVVLSNEIDRRNVFKIDFSTQKTRQI